MNITKVDVDWSRISANLASQAMREAGHVYLDVRTVEEFELGHVEGAYNVPWELRGQRRNPDFARVVTAAFGCEQPMIVGCQSGVRSALASAALVELGFVQVFEQHAGYAGKRDAFGKLLEPGWQRAGLPIGMQAQLGRSYRELYERWAGTESARETR
jgi:rhodanese-related sulfurtransferase